MNILLILACVCELIAALMGFDIIAETHVLGWIALGLFFFFLSGVVPAIAIGPRRV